MSREVEVLLSLEDTLCKDMKALSVSVMVRGQRREKPSLYCQGSQLGRKRCSCSPLKRYLYTSRRFFLGISMVESPFASAQGQLDSPVETVVSGERARSSAMIGGG